MEARPQARARRLPGSRSEGGRVWCPAEVCGPRRKEGTPWGVSSGRCSCPACVLTAALYNGDRPAGSVQLLSSTPGSARSPNLTRTRGRPRAWSASFRARSLGLREGRAGGCSALYCSCLRVARSREAQARWGYPRGVPGPRSLGPLRLALASC